MKHRDLTKGNIMNIHRTITPHFLSKNIPIELTSNNIITPNNLINAKYAISFPPILKIYTIYIILKKQHFSKKDYNLKYSNNYN